MESPAENAAVASVPDLTPLLLRRTGNHLQFILRTQDEILGELPADYEQLLQVRLANILKEPAPLTAELNLLHMAGVNSRQLGSLIALGKVLRPRFGPVPMIGVSPAVRHLLQMTRTDQLFKLT